MKFKIDHVFRAELNGKIKELFHNCKSLSAYIENLRKLENQATTKFFAWHGFQALVEAIIKYNNIVDNYEVLATRESDLQIHGKGEDCTIGIFYIPTDGENFLTANRNHLTTFFANSLEHYGINKMFVFSNARGVHEYTKRAFIEDMGANDDISLFMRGDVEALVDDNVDFWNTYFAALKSQKRQVKLKTLREHQIKAVESCQKSDKGRIILPTGVGKSLIEAELIKKCIENKREAVCVIATPRIVLTRQLLNTVFEHLVGSGINAQYLNLNSGAFDEDRLIKTMVEMGLTPRNIPSTTSPQVVKEYYNEAKALEIPLIICATYQSAPKLLNVIPIDLLLNDEAHNLVMGRFSTDIKKQVHDIPAKQKYSLTATEAKTSSEEGVGMENTSLFGEMLYTRSPREMIEKGEIVPPYIHQVGIDEYKIRKNKKLPPIQGDIGEVEHNIEVSAAVVVETYVEHRKLVKKRSAHPDKIGAKLLVVCKGEPSFSGLFNSKILKQFKKDNPNVKLYGISSASGAYIDGNRISSQGSSFKEQFMLGLTSLKDTDNAIIINIDMLGEGVDVPGITGVMPFRDMGIIKSSQTLGRAMRLCNEDRKKLYAGEIQPLEWNKMIKPRAWVVLPIYSWEQKDSFARILDIAKNMWNELGYMPVEYVNGGLADGRMEELQKDSDMFGKTPDEITLIHAIQEIEFQQAADAVIPAILADMDEMQFVKEKIMSKIQ